MNGSMNEFLVVDFHCDHNDIPLLKHSTDVVAVVHYVL